MYTIWRSRWIPCCFFLGSEFHHCCSFCIMMWWWYREVEGSQYGGRGKSIKCYQIKGNDWREWKVWNGAQFLKCHIFPNPNIASNKTATILGETYSLLPNKKQGLLSLRSNFGWPYLCYFSNKSFEIWNIGSHGLGDDTLSISLRSSEKLVSYDHRKNTILPSAE